MPPNPTTDELQSDTLDNIAKRGHHLFSDTQGWARYTATFRPFALAPAHATVVGVGHLAYTIGPITFCKRCGATKSLSQGLSLRRPCRRWAPPGTRSCIKSLLRGKPQPFYRRILQNAAVPVRRLRGKTTPAPRYVIPQHLQAHDDPPTTPPPRPIRITRHTVWRGRAADVSSQGGGEPDASA